MFIRLLSYCDVAEPGQIGLQYSVTLVMDGVIDATMISVFSFTLLLGSFYSLPTSSCNKYNNLSHRLTVAFATVPEVVCIIISSLFILLIYILVLFIQGVSTYYYYYGLFMFGIFSHICILAYVLLLSIRFVFFNPVRDIIKYLDSIGVFDEFYEHPSIKRFFKKKKNYSKYSSIFKIIKKYL